MRPSLIYFYVHYEIFPVAERNVVWEERWVWDEVLVWGVQFGWVSVVVMGDGSCEVTDGLGDGAPIEWAGDSPKGEAKGHQRDPFCRELCARLECDFVVHVEATVS